MTIKANTDLMAGLAHTETYADVDYVLRRRMCRTSYPMEVAVGNITDGHPVLRPEKACTIKAIRIIPGAALTAHNTKYNTITFATEDTVGAGAVAGSTAIATAITTKITGTGNWVQGVPEAITVTDTTASVAEGQTVFMIETVATGVALPDCMIEVDYEYI